MTFNVTPKLKNLLKDLKDLKDLNNANLVSGDAQGHFFGSLLNQYGLAHQGILFLSSKCPNQRRVHQWCWPKDVNMCPDTELEARIWLFVTYMMLAPGRGKITEYIFWFLRRTCQQTP